MIRRYGSPPMAGRRYKRRAGVYAVLLRDGEILLTFQSGPEPELQLPGGGIEPGEQPVTALAREVREETGWHIAAPRRIGTFRRFTFMPDYDLWAEKVCTVYLARPTLRVSTTLEAGHTAVWTPAGTAPGLLQNAGDRSMLLSVLGRRG